MTGGAGYIGSSLIRQLRDSRWSVRVLDNLQRGGYAALMDLDGAAGVEFVEGDILDPVVVGLALEDVDAVVHLAAVGGTPLSFEHPRWTEQVNHWGTTHLVEACLEAGVPRFIYTSSASVYGPCENADERTPCRPIGPYALSKLAAEQAVSAAAARGIVPTTLRIGAIFGEAPVLRFDAMPNRLAYLAGTGRALTIFGDGRQARPLTHVDDACSAIRFCLERQEETAGGTFNVLTENGTVLDVVEALKGARPQTRVRFTEQDVRTHLSFSIDGSALTDLGWSAQKGLREGIAALVGRFQGVVSPASDAATDPGVPGLTTSDWMND